MFHVPRFHDEESHHQAQVREQSEVIAQLRHEISEITLAFKTQIHSLQGEHNRVSKGLKEELKVRYQAPKLVEGEAALPYRHTSNSAGFS